MIYLITFLMIFTISCGTQEEGLTTEEEIREKEKVIEVLKAYNSAYQKKNFAEMVRYLANELTFFGSDSAEVIKSLSEFKVAIEEQWKEIDSMRYGEMSDIYVLMDSRGMIASAMYGIPFEIWTNGKHIKLFLRISRTLKKEGGNWVIVSGVTGITTASRSVKELLRE